MRDRGKRPAAQAGYTLVEIIVALFIVAMVSGGAIVGLRSLVKTELRGAATKLAAAIRYSYDRAITTGAFYRLHMNLDNQNYRLERSETRMVLAVKETSGRAGRGDDKDIADKIAEEEEKKGQSTPVTPEMAPPPSPRRPKFAQYKDSSLPVVKLSRIKILDIYTPRQPEPYSAGHAYLHFFPDGHTERAIIHLGTDPADTENQYSLIVHGLTGRVEVRVGRIAPPPDFEAGDSEKPRGGS